MAQVYVKYNPYRLETTVKVNGRDVSTDSILYKVTKGKRLQEWIGKFPKMLREELNTLDFSLEYCGMELDWDDFQDAFEQALNGDSIGYAGFLKVADDYSGTKAANLAKAYAGICYAQLGKYEDAVKMLDSFDGSDQMVAPAILGAAGNCYAQLGQLDKAASTLLSAADKADNNTLSPIFLLQAGEILVKQGKYDDAVNAYTKIKDKYFQSYQAMDIDKYIEQAKLMKK